MSDAPEVGGPEGNGSGGSIGKLLQRIAPDNVKWREVLLLPLLAVLSALVVGAVIITLTDGTSEIWPAYKGLFSGAFVGWSSVSETLVAAAPLILAGLSVAIGFKAGLFNIGAEGQMVIGGLTAAIAGFTFTGLPAFIHLPVALLAGVVGGVIWGGFPGWLRAKTGAHEVITTIMLNWISFRLLDYLLKVPWIQKEGRFDPISKDVFASARLPRILSWLPVNGAEGLRVNLGFVLAILAAWFTYWLLFRTTIGFEFRAVGLNPHGAKYAGISVTRATVAVMAVAGALSGLAGAGETLGILGRASPGFSSNIGFDAIALALLGRSHPVGVVFAGLLFGALRAGGRTMQAQSGVGVDLITIVQALIIVFIAAPDLVRAVFRVKTGAQSEQVTRGWSV